MKHVKPCLAGQTLMIIGKIVKVYERKGNHLCIVCASLLDIQGNILCLFEHTTIFHIAKKKASL